MALILGSVPPFSRTVRTEYAHISPQASSPYSFEPALKDFYQFYPIKWALLMPDLHYIVLPGRLHPNAFVGTPRSVVQF